MIEQIPFSKLPGFSKLFQDYVDLNPDLLSNYAGRFNSDDDIERRCELLSRDLKSKPELAAALLEQNQRWNAGADVIANIERLGAGEVLAIVTGQQIGLFANPLYIIYKALTAVQLAEYVSTELGRPCVPIFWMATGDHDFEEIRRAHFPTTDGLKSVEIERPSGYTGPVGRIQLDKDIDKIISNLRPLFPDREGVEQSLKMLAQSYGKEKTLEDAFGSLITELFAETGLIVVSPDDAELKRLAIPIFEKEIVDPTGVFEALSVQSEEMERSHHVQVEPALHNLFYFGEDSRSKLTFKDDKWFAGKERFSQNELLERLYRNPENFSPNVVLRPLMQDKLFPTVAYVAGPGETAYFGQLKAVYKWAEVSMPIIYPRASVTIIESRIEKILKKHELELADLGVHEPNKFFSNLAIESLDLDLDAIFEALQSEVDTAFAVLEEHVGKVDRTMKKSSKARQVAVLKEIENLKKKVVRIQKKKMSHEQSQIGELFSHLQPNGGLQERKISAMYYVARFGPELIKTLRNELLLDTTQHQVVRM